MFVLILLILFYVYKDGRYENQPEWSRRISSCSGDDKNPASLLLCHTLVSQFTLNDLFDDIKVDETSWLAAEQWLVRWTKKLVAAINDFTRTRWRHSFHENV